LKSRRNLGTTLKLQHHAAARSNRVVPFQVEKSSMRGEIRQESTKVPLLNQYSQN
jgi:hypothetical protein